MKVITYEVEEYEQGAWVAQLVSLDAFSDSVMVDDVTWSGTIANSRLEFERYRSTIVGGANGLAKILEDKFYSGSVSLQAALSDICRESGETFGAGTAQVFMPSFERLRGPAYQALDALAEATKCIWWIARDGSVQMKAARDVGGEATGVRVSGESDSVLLVNPQNLTVGGTYDGKTVRHIRWLYSTQRTAAEVYFIPFVFRPPTDKRYSSLDTARVDRDRGDGTIDVIVAGRYGLTQIPFYCGVPGSKVKVNGGELVQVGYFGGDPQKPFATSMAQNTAATKQVARNGDSVKVSFDTAAVAALAPFFNSPAGPCTGLPVVPLPIDVTGSITSGSERLKVGD